MTTTNAVPSSDVSDFVYNVQKLDEAVTGSALTYIDRLGVERLTAAGAMARFAALNPRGAWATSTVYQPRDLVLESGTWYISLDTHTSGATFAGDLTAHWRPEQGVTEADLNDVVSASRGSGIPGFTRNLPYSVTSIGGAVNEALDDIDAIVPGEKSIGHYANALYQGATVTIDCFGDSTMWGDNGGTGVQAATTQPSRLQFFLRAYYANSAAVVVNRAISGTDTTGMLAGTDGSGSTFASKMASTSASVVYCNHCINDVNGSITGEQFKDNWVSIIKIIRANARVPVLVTPAPMLTVSSVVFDANAEKLRKFVEIMRTVAHEYNVSLVDQYDLVTRIYRSGAARTTDLMPDGEHPSEVLYKQMGNNLAIPWVSTKADALGFIPAIHPTVQSTGANGTKGINLPYSRVGSGRWTGASGTQTIRAAILVEDSFTDLCVAQMLWDEGAALGALSVDFAAAGTLTWYQNQPWTSNFSHDYEVIAARNLWPGLHFVEASNSGSGRLGINYYRLRPQARPKLSVGTGTNSAALPGVSRRIRLAEKLVFQPNDITTSAVALFDDMPATGLLAEVHSVEFVAALANDHFVILRGCTGSYQHSVSGVGNLIPHLAVGLNGSGYLTVFEFTPAFARATPLDAVNRAGVANTYRVDTFNGTMTCYVNGAVIGTVPPLLEADLKGGFVGVYTFNTVTTLTIDSLDMIC